MTNHDARLISQAPDMLKTICHTYLNLLITMPPSYRNTTPGQQMLSTLRGQICAATGQEDQTVQEYYEDLAFECKNENK